MKEYHLEQFQKDILSLNLKLSPDQMNQFLLYYEMLTEWNQVMNLTAITDFDDVMKKHFIDSLSIVHAANLTGEISLIDVGTGAGFPGLVLKIAFPQIQVTLLDSLNKRIQFLNAVIEKLDLKGVKTLHGRAEDYARLDMFREKFDFCVSRAVANLSILSEYCIPFIKIGGRFISYKSKNIEKELKESKKAIKILGGNLEKNVDFILPDSDIARCLLVIRKVKSTPLKYPRKAGLPERDPVKN